MNIRSAVLFVALTSAALGCEDPAKGKVRAEVAEAAKSAEAPANATAEKLALTSSNTKLSWVGSKVTGKHEGSFKTLSGSVELTDGKAEAAKVSVEIDMASVDSDHPKLTGHLKSGDFFDVGTHPKSKFVSTKIAAGGKDGATHTITGNLTLRGQTKSVSFPAKVQLDKSKLHVGAEFVINRKDFGIAYPGKPDDLIRDDVVLKLEIDVPRSSN